MTVLKKEHCIVLKMMYNKINILNAIDFAKQNGYDTEINCHFVKKSIVIDQFIIIKNVIN